ncbi:MAG: hypothetical protein OXU53_11245 [Deltaproteobacteria bacterium]|nr:hypothetical protein [Deltaproteobacteria bacterium]MDD9872948.1 hypothetical protein [Deltaproteobacteria bacterium]
MQAQFLRRFFAPTTITLAIATAVLLAPLATTAAAVPEVPEVRCQAFDGPLAGFDYQRAISIRGESPNSRHIISTSTDGIVGRQGEFHSWTVLQDLPGGQEDPFEQIIRDIEAAWRGAGITPPAITDTGPADFPAGTPRVLRTAIQECDLVIKYLISNVERRSYDGRVITDAEHTAQGLRADAAAAEARRQLAPGKKKSSSGGTIAAIGGAALVAGGLTWLLWPDAKQTIQPYAQGKNDGRGYAAGLQISVGRNQTFTLTQTDGPRKNRHTQIQWKLQW